MESRAYALLTGLFVIVVVAGIIAWANWLARDTQERAPYRVVSSIAVTGLNPQAQVRYRGMGVGRVTAIGLDKKDQRRILIDIEVDKAIPITRGTYAQLGLEGITGIAYVHLQDEGGDRQAPDKAADGVIELPLRPSFMDAITDGAEGAVRDARQLMAAVNEILTPENRKRIGAVLVSLERSMANLEATSQKLPGAIERVDARLGAWLGDENLRLARESLASVNQAAKAFPELARESQQLAKDARDLVEKLGRLSADAQGAAAMLRDDTLPGINAAAESVERGAQRVGRLASEIESQPDSLLWGRRAAHPGPGEPGFQ
jgi:phospholipid/cholesterol/gamma-HCH transport system substrate-binding protein